MQFCIQSGFLLNSVQVYVSFEKYEIYPETIGNRLVPRHFSQTDETVCEDQDVTSFTF